MRGIKSKKCILRKKKEINTKIITLLEIDIILLLKKTIKNERQIRRN